MTFNEFYYNEKTRSQSAQKAKPKALPNHAHFMRISYKNRKVNVRFLAFHLTVMNGDPQMFGYDRLRLNKLV